jgi:hypothetical protein
MCNAKNTDATKATLLLLMRPKISSPCPITGYVKIAMENGDLLEKYGTYGDLW